MKTYQDFLESQNDIPGFISSAISEYKSSAEYKNAKTADAYDKQENTTIIRYEKYLRTMTGQLIHDDFSANHKLASNFYNKFNVQENQYLLANGVTFTKKDTKDKLGTGKKAFDTQLQKLGKKALTHRVAYGYYNADHIEVFEALEFVPLIDEEDGAMKAGIRFWQVSENKPMRATLYELDGYTQYIKRTRGKKETSYEIYKPKSPYKYHKRESIVDGVELYDGENYPSFPIVPLWGNQDHICKIVPWRRGIDCYDLVKSGFANDIDDANFIFWCISNAGGMDDVDLAEFLQKMRTLHATTLDDGVSVTPHTQDIPVTARETLLNRVETDLYKDAMALDTEAIAKGNTVATAIRAAYEPLNNKTDDFEYCVIEFIQGILELIGVEDDPTFKRSTIVNQTEETQMVLSAAQYLDNETVLRHLPFLSVDEIPDILNNKTREEAERTENAIIQQQMMNELDGEKKEEEPKEE